MLFSTLIPTLLHFALAGASVLMWFPAQWWKGMTENWENHADKKVWIAFYISVMPVIGFVITPAVLLGGLWWFLSENGAGIGSGLITLFEQLFTH